VDAIILATAGFKDAKPWIKFDSIDEYAHLIGRFRSSALGQPLALWDLEHWSAQTAKDPRPRAGVAERSTIDREPS